MDFREVISNTWETVKEKLSPIIERIKTFVRENTLVSACTGALILIIIIAVILLCTALKKPEDTGHERPVTISEKMFIPPSPSIPEGYIYSRTTKESWTEDEIDPWFTKPGDKELEDLSRSNDRLINDIIGAAP